MLLSRWLKGLWHVVHGDGGRHDGLTEERAAEHSRPLSNAINNTGPRDRPRREG